MSPRLTGNFLLGDTEKNDNRATIGALITLEIRTKRLLHDWRCELRSQGSGQGADHLTSSPRASRSFEVELSEISAYAIHATVEEQLSAQRAITSNKPTPETAHPTSRAGESCAANRDTQSGIDQRCSIHGAVHSVFNQHRQQTN